MFTTPEHLQQFKQEGYFILENVMSEQQLEALRQESQFYVNAYEAEIAAAAAANPMISHYKKRYFVGNRPDQNTITEFISGDVMTEVCHAILGDNVYLFDEQYVVKPAGGDTKFGWHQHSGYLGYYHEPYLCCWCALDDMSIENGTIYVLPYARANMTANDLFEHHIENGTDDKIGYYGDDPGIPVIIPAGSIVVFSSRLFHRSGMNTTNRMRRTYLVQYSSKPVMSQDGKKLQGKAIPILKNGQRVVPVWPTT